MSSKPRTAMAVWGHHHVWAIYACSMGRPEKMVLGRIKSTISPRADTTEYQSGRPVCVHTLAFFAFVALGHHVPSGN
jgi:hypothetical protein